MQRSLCPGCWSTAVPTPPPPRPLVLLRPRRASLPVRWICPSLNALPSAGAPPPRPRAGSALRWRSRREAAGSGRDRTGQPGLPSESSAPQPGCWRRGTDAWRSRWLYLYLAKVFWLYNIAGDFFKCFIRQMYPSGKCLGTDCQHEAVLCRGSQRREFSSEEEIMGRGAGGNRKSREGLYFN